MFQDFSFNLWLLRVSCEIMKIIFSIITDFNPNIYEFIYQN